MLLPGQVAISEDSEEEEISTDDDICVEDKGLNPGRTTPSSSEQKNQLRVNIELFKRFLKRQTAPFEPSTELVLLQVLHDFQIAGNKLCTTLVTTSKDYKRFKIAPMVYRLKLYGSSY
ncbi:hypothetical protein AVEN_205385-1 [Araneus ventricosus]|uniref:Uncharacterized protein n=1 Tax=Araneus ventricosus TaxID=182803 RepID=A0A4Y2HWY5_ARAVE|nr:hypothetical protein AVEN_205385-1 [Araneus ventricosus]